MIYNFPCDGYSYKRSKAFIDWITEERFGQEDKGACMTIEASSDEEAVKRFYRQVAYGRYIGAYQ